MKQHNTKSWKIFIQSYKSTLQYLYIVCLLIAALIFNLHVLQTDQKPFVIEIINAMTWTCGLMIPIFLYLIIITGIYETQQYKARISKDK